MNTRALLTGGILLLCTAAPSSAQSIISGWDFQNLPVGANSNPASDLGSVSGNATTLGMTNTYGTPGPSMDISDILLIGAGGSDPAGAASNGWRVRGGMVTGGSTAANGWSSLAPIGTQGAQFLVNTTGFSGIQVQFDVLTTTQAEANLQLEYTLNGSSWFNAPITFSGTGAAIKVNSTSANTVMGTYIQFTTGTFYDAITANLGGISGAGNDPNFGVRLVNASTGLDDINGSGTAYNNSSGNWRFDEVKVLGVSNTVPEPGATALLLGLASLGLVLVNRQRKGNAA